MRCCSLTRSFFFLNFAIPTESLHFSFAQTLSNYVKLARRPSLRCNFFDWQWKNWYFWNVFLLLWTVCYYKLQILHIYVLLYILNNRSLSNVLLHRDFQTDSSQGVFTSYNKYLTLFQCVRNVPLNYYPKCILKSQLFTFNCSSCYLFQFLYRNFWPTLHA